MVLHASFVPRAAGEGSELVTSVVAVRYSQRATTLLVQGGSKRTSSLQFTSDNTTYFHTYMYMYMYMYVYMSYMYMFSCRVVERKADRRPHSTAPGNVYRHPRSLRVARRNSMRAVRATVPNAFRPVIDWDARRWLPWEKTLWASMQKPVVGAALLLFLVPLSIVALPLAPLLSLAALRAPPAPRGLHDVGSAEVQQLIGTESVLPPKMLRLRVFYPARPVRSASGKPRLFDHAGGWSRRAWLPPDNTRGRYATQHAHALPFPKKLSSILAPYLGWVLRFAKLPRRVVRGAPPLSHTAGGDGGWPLVVFSHGLYGCAAGYSALCAELASHGSVVVAIEHKDGSAVYTETDDGDAMAYTVPDESQGGREAQQAVRTAEVRGVLERIGEVTAAVAGEEGMARNEGVEGVEVVDAPLRLDTSGGVTLMGHSFGGSTALRTAAEIEASGGPIAIRAVVASDPWIAGYNASTHGVTTSPTMALCTQSMMYPPNANAVGGVLEQVSAGGRTIAFYAEASETRHQEVSDYPSLLHPILRFFAMAGARNPHRAHQQQSALIVGFLTLVNALVTDKGGVHLTKYRAMARRLITPGSEDEPGDDDEDASYVVHGATVPSAWQRDWQSAEAPMAVSMAEVRKGPSVAAAPSTERPQSYSASPTNRLRNELV